MDKNNRRVVNDVIVYLKNSRTTKPENPSWIYMDGTVVWRSDGKDHRKGRPSIFYLRYMTDFNLRLDWWEDNVCLKTIQA